MKPELSQGLFGAVLPDKEVILPGGPYPSPLKAQGLSDIQECRSLSVVYLMPSLPIGYVYKSVVLPGAKFPDRVLTSDDDYTIRTGRRRNNREAR